MPFFKFRRGDLSANSVLPAAAAQAQSVEVLRKRAKHRLMGACVLVLLGVVGFPLLFETQPRPVAVDIPIEIPGKNTVKPLVLPAPAAANAPAAMSTERVAAAASLSPQEEIYTSKPVEGPAVPALPAIKKEVKPEAKPEAKPVVKAEAKPPAVKPEARAEAKPEARPVARAEATPPARPEARPEVRIEPKPEVKPPAKPALAKAEDKPDNRPVQRPPAAADDSARAVALLNGTATSKPVAAPVAKPAAAVAAKPEAVDQTKVAAAAETKGRMVVQVGAFADTAKADEARAKLEKAGLKTYTQVADTKDGKRTRVRVGPFATKAEAEKAIGKIRSLDLPVAILSF
ncbi:MAG: Sporulation domain protein [Polaromonas sp.]|nr:Sporulation domain protein [Polaromonas sp.]